MASRCCWSRTAVLAWVLAVVSGQNLDDCPAGPNVAGIVVGCILATLAVVGIVIAVILYIRYKRQNKKARPATKTGDAGLEQAHVNPAYDETGDVSRHVDTPNDINFAEQGFAGYVPCKEFESTTKKEPVRSPPRSNGSLGRSASPVAGKLPLHGFGTKLTKSGSHGSLDDSFPSLAVHSSAIELSQIRILDPEVITVPLQSQDIIGLGFNICGNLRDGIFVSQVHNRGPASESRLIKPGDRILGITISFENMVYEDALTILSYASPYPVQLQVQKKPLKSSDLDVTGDDYEEALHLHHPVYRSQSMDDVSKIAQESVFRVRRARSEMKRGSSKRKQEEEVIVEEGRLRKWSGKPNFGEPVAPGDAASDEKSENSTVSIPDLQLNSHTSDLLGSYNSKSGEVIEATVHHQLQSGKFTAVDNLEMDEINLEANLPDQTEAPTLGLSPKRQAEQDRKEGLRLSYEADHTPVRKLDLEDAIDFELRKDAIKVSDETDGSIHLDAATKDVIPQLDDLHDSDRSPSPIILTEDMGIDLKIGTSFDEHNSPADSSMVIPEVGQEVAINTDSIDESITFVTEHDGYLDGDLKASQISSDQTDSISPPPSPPPGPPPAGDSAADITTSSMNVLLSEESIMIREEEALLATQGEFPSDDKDSDDSVRAVLQDYFSDQPSLMECLGLTGPSMREDSVEKEGDANDVILPKRLSSTSATRTISNEPLEYTVKNGIALQEAKIAIRRRSSSSEEEPHASSPSTLSSRSSSPTEPQHVEEQATSEHGDETLSEPATEKAEKRVSHSPLVKKKSAGGLMYDISTKEYEEMPEDVPEKERMKMNPSAGVAYYVSIDDQFQGAPLTLRPDDEEDNEEKPSLMKVLGGFDKTTTPMFEVHDDDISSQQVNEVVTIETVPSEGEPDLMVTETRTMSMATVHQMSNNNNESGMNGKSSESPISSPLKLTRDVTTDVSKSNEVITVRRHEEIRGPFTLTVNTTSSHNDDSEA